MRIPELFNEFNSEVFLVERRVPFKGIYGFWVWGFEGTVREPFIKGSIWVLIRDFKGLGFMI